MAGLKDSTVYKITVSIILQYTYLSRSDPFSTDECALVVSFNTDFFQKRVFRVVDEQIAKRASSETHMPMAVEGDLWRK